MQEWWSRSAGRCRSGGAGPPGGAGVMQQVRRAAAARGAGGAARRVTGSGSGSVAGSERWSADRA